MTTRSMGVRLCDFSPEDTALGTSETNVWLSCDTATIVSAATANLLFLKEARQSMAQETGRLPPANAVLAEIVSASVDISEIHDVAKSRCQPNPR